MKSKCVTHVLLVLVAVAIQLPAQQNESARKAFEETKAKAEKSDPPDLPGTKKTNRRPFTPEELNRPSTVAVGDTTITLPSPKGYYRIDGKNDKIDAVLRASMGEDVRLIAWYGSEVALAETLSGKMSADEGVNFRAITGTRLEKISVTPERFKSFKAETIKDSKAFVEEVNKQEIEQAGSEAMSILRKKAIEMKVGEMVSLGVYDETEESISYSLLMKVEANIPGSTNKASAVIVQAQSQVLVHNHLISLSCDTVFSKGSNIESVRKNLKEWKDSFLLLNKPLPDKR